MFVPIPITASEPFPSPVNIYCVRAALLEVNTFIDDLDAGVFPSAFASAVGAWLDVTAVNVFTVVVESSLSFLSLSLSTFKITESNGINTVASSLSLSLVATDCATIGTVDWINVAIFPESSEPELLKSNVPSASIEALMNGTKVPPPGLSLPTFSTDIVTEPAANGEYIITWTGWFLSPYVKNVLDAKFNGFPSLPLAPVVLLSTIVIGLSASIISPKFKLAAAILPLEYLYSINIVSFNGRVTSTDEPVPNIEIVVLSSKVPYTTSASTCPLEPDIKHTNLELATSKHSLCGI